MPKNPRSVSKKDVELGNKIRARRLIADMTQEQLGKKLGLTFQQVQKYEKGTNRVTFNRMQEIANALDENIGYFLAPSNPPSPAWQKILTLLAEPHVVHLLQAYGKIKDAQKIGLLIQLAESMST